MHIDVQRTITKVPYLSLTLTLTKHGPTDLHCEAERTVHTYLGPRYYTILPRQVLRVKRHSLMLKIG